MCLRFDVLPIAGDARFEMRGTRSSVPGSETSLQDINRPALLQDGHTQRADPIRNFRSQALPLRRKGLCPFGPQGMRRTVFTRSKRQPAPVTSRPRVRRSIDRGQQAGVAKYARVAILPYAKRSPATRHSGPQNAPARYPSRRRQCGFGGSATSIFDNHAGNPNPTACSSLTWMELT